MGNLIDRIKKRIDNLKFKNTYGHFILDYNEILLAIYEEVEKEPICEWKFDSEGVGHYHCSNCGGQGDFYGRYKYCPHCGVKMK